MSCHYRYGIQPWPTEETCPFEGHSRTALILQCQVVSNRNTTFTITWHYSELEPTNTGLRAITSPQTVINNSSTTVINTTETMAQNALLSQLTLKGFDHKSAGYYWCSVNSSSEVDTQNPSIVLHIVHNTRCKENSNKRHCHGNVHLYSSEFPSVRCADNEIDINILEAQNCSNNMTTLKDDKLKEVTLEPRPTALGPDNLPTQTSEQESTSQHTPKEATTLTSAPTFRLSTGEIIGASMGGLSLILIIMIGLLLLCMVRMKHGHRASENTDNQISPFDDIRMNSSIAELAQEKVDDANRASKLYCESNMAYECPHALRMLTTQSNESVYEFIH